MRRLIVVWLLLCASVAARGDGGRLLLRRAAGPFVISLFSVPESIGVGEADVSAMVEDGATGSVLLNPRIVLTLTPPNGAAPVTAQLSHAHATNRVLQDAVVRLEQPGEWKASISVTDGERQAHTDFVLTVANEPAERSTIWIFALLPVASILLFAWTQSAKRLRSRSRAGSPGSAV